MTLNEYIESRGVRKGWFAEQIGVSRAMLYQYIARTATPSIGIIMRIKHETGGKVGPEDWVRRGAAE